MERQVEVLSSTTSTLGCITPGWVMFLIAFSLPSSLIHLPSARVTSISSSRYMLKNNVVFVHKRARIVAYAPSRLCLPYWHHDKKVLSDGEDIFTVRVCLMLSSFALSCRVLARLRRAKSCSVSCEKCASRIFHTTHYNKRAPQARARDERQRSC